MGNIAKMIEELVDELEAEWAKRSDGEKSGEEYNNFLTTQEMVKAKNGSFHLGLDGMSAGVVAVIVIFSLAFVGFLGWIAFSKHKHGKFFYMPAACSGLCGSCCPTKKSKMPKTLCVPFKGKGEAP